MSKAMISMAAGKILLAKTTRSFYEKYKIFAPNFAHSLRLNCHSTCPLPQRILLSKRTSRLYESLLITCVVPFLRKQSDFAFLEVQNSPEITLFRDLSACVTGHGSTHANLELVKDFSLSNGSS